MAPPKIPRILTSRMPALLLNLAYFSASTESVRAQDGPREAYIPILCVTAGDKPTGMVIYLLLLFADRDDTDGLNVHFLSGPGRFSDKSKIATRQAITDAAHAMGLYTETWNVGISMPYPGLLLDGDSLSAMVSLTVVAMARGETVPPRHVISGTITSDGHIGPVSHVGLKVAAANQAGLLTIILPPTTPNGWHPPASVQVSRVSTVRQAYQALMAPRHLFADGHARKSDANQS